MRSSEREDQCRGDRDGSGGGAPGLCSPAKRGSGMVFAGINYWAVLVAAAAGFALGGVWYRGLAKPWMAAHGFTSEQIRAHHGKGTSPLPLVIAVIADVAMAWVLAGLIGHIGA